MGAGTFALERIGDVATLRMDDGKANAFTATWAQQLDGALDELESADAGAVVLSGREGRFCAGFDLSVMANGVDAALPVMEATARALMRLYVFPKPVVIECTGHAIAGGAVLLMLGDLRVGADADYKIGLTEVGIGLPLPEFAMEPVREHLSPRFLSRAMNNSEVLTPALALEAGFLDRLVAPEELHSASLAAAESLAKLDASAFAETKRRLRGGLAERVLGNLSGDLRLLRPFLERH